MSYWYGDGVVSVVRCCHSFTYWKKYICKVSWPIVIKFHVSHHQVRGERLFKDSADWIGTLVALATLSSYRLIMEKTLKNLL